MRSFRVVVLLAALAFFAGAGALPIVSAEPLSQSYAGRWDGRLVVPRPDGSSQDESFALRLVPEGFVLVDFPDRNIYGFPARVALKGGALAFSLGTGQGKLDFGLGSPSGNLLPGTVAQGSVKGSFSLDRHATPAFYGTSRAVTRPGGVIRGSLVLPSAAGASADAAPARPSAGTAAAGTVAAGTAGTAGADVPARAGAPLAILVAGSGQTDRDGNNYQVPGRSDSLRLLAEALAARGVASYRYDRRGVGESIALAPAEDSLRFEDEVADLGTIVASFARDPSFSRIILVGHSDGALVAASLLADARTGSPARGLPLVVLGAGATSALDSFRAAIEKAPDSERAEGEAILSAILAGNTWPKPSTYYADFFRPSFQPYLAGWLKRSLKELLPVTGGPVLLIEGDRDMQVDLADFLGLAAARPDAEAAVVAGMNHVLKAVPADVDANFASFSDPRYPVSDDLAAAIAAFAREEALPPNLGRVDGGKLPQSAGG